MLAPVPVVLAPAPVPAAADEKLIFLVAGVPARQSCVNDNFSLPTPELLRLQAEWLFEARSRILRNVGIAHRRSVLDLGAGYGIITSELQRRTSGRVIALDRSLQALKKIDLWDGHPCPPGELSSREVAGAEACPTDRVCAHAQQLPFRPATFDLVFSQNVLLWLREMRDVIAGVHRLLQHQGIWVLFEADYGGMIEYPPQIETAHLWIAALQRAGADPYIARSIPSALSAAGFSVRTELLPRMMSPQMERFDFLAGLDLTEQEKQHLAGVRAACEKLSPEQQTVHLPFFLIIAERP